MAQIGNKINSYLSGIWAKHGRKFGKRLAARRRRIESARTIKQRLIEHLCQ